MNFWYRQPKDISLQNQRNLLQNISKLSSKSPTLDRIAELLQQRHDSTFRLRLIRGLNGQALAECPSKPAVSSGFLHLNLRLPARICAFQCLQGMWALDGLFAGMLVHHLLMLYSTHLHDLSWALLTPQPEQGHKGGVHVGMRAKEAPDKQEETEMVKKVITSREARRPTHPS